MTHSGALLLEETIKISGLDAALSQALAPWRRRRARHDPGKAVLDLAVAVALGGDCAADLAAVRAQPSLFGQVASDPTISRLFATLCTEDADALAAIDAIRAARAAARERVWDRRRPMAGTPGRRVGGQVFIDIDATLVDAHSDKQHAEPTHKRTFGFAPMCAFIGERGNARPAAQDSATHHACPVGIAQQRVDSRAADTTPPTGVAATVGELVAHDGPQHLGADPELVVVESVDESLDG